MMNNIDKLMKTQKILITALELAAFVTVPAFIIILIILTNY